MNRQKAILIVKNNWPENPNILGEEKIRKWIVRTLKSLNNSSIQIDGAYEMMLPAIAWLEKQGKKKTKDAYTFNSIPRLLDMIKPTNKTKVYCQKLIDSLLQEGYVTDAKIVNDYLKQMNGEKIAMATMNEQKPVDNDEPKLEIGDLITNGILVGKIDEINERGYHAYFGDCYADVPDIENWHKWTIQDAKDGNMISYRDGLWIFIYKKLVDGDTFCYHALYSTLHQDLTIDDAAFTLLGSAIKPATKEQRDTLIKAMADAGYTFDFEKKELKKIENEIEIPFGAKDSELQEATYYVAEGFHAEIDDDKVVIKKGGKPTAWSEGDENVTDIILSQLRSDNFSGVLSKSLLKEAESWFKSLKNRVQPKQKWSGEDEGIYQSIMDDTVQENQLDEKQIDWLRNIKFRNQWKPSEEQMDALHYVSNFDYGGHKAVLVSLYEQLKQL